MTRLAAALAGIALACLPLVASAEAGVRPAPPPPPWTGAYQPHGVDEIGMWREDDEEERALVNSPILIRDEALTAYVKGVLCDAVGTDRCAATRVYILREPTFNATMSPNGTMRVYSGLLLRVRNEAELAAVLGHEFGHFERRHQLAFFKSHRASTDLLQWATVLASMSNSYAVQRSFNDLNLSVYGNLYRFKRDEEREADLVGLGYLNASRLRPQAAADVWRHLMDEMNASARTRGLKSPRFDAIAFTATHPPHAERAAYLGQLAAPDGAARGDGAAAYRAAMTKWMPVFLSDQIKLNDFGGSEYLLMEMGDTWPTAPLWQARGDLYRTRGAPRDLVNAAEFYAQAIALEPDLAEAHRGLGLSLVKIGRVEQGRESLRRYLALKPDAADAATIGMVLASTGGKQ